jgi:glycosyltransferase involved in cell wall biosynthesis
MSEGVSIIIPAFNEAHVIGRVLFDLRLALEQKGLPFEIIVVNDGSTDATAEEATKTGVKVLSHPYNKGYGAAIRTGVKEAKYGWLGFYDADGQHTPETLISLLPFMADYDMVVGAREGYKGPAIRQPGKKLLQWIANYLSDVKIPDINSGLRLVKKELYLRFAHLFPPQYGWTTAITLAALKDNYSVKYVPITIRPRQGGKSMVRVSDALRMFMLILRIILLFSPLRVFMPLAFVSFILGIGFAGGELIFTGKLGKVEIIFFTAGLFFFFFGLLMDQVSALRREVKRD